jgi:hypothetical protein
MTNGAMNVEIGNPTYKMYEGGDPDDVGGLLDADFALDPDKVRGRQRRGFQDRVPKGVGLDDGMEVGHKGKLGHRAQFLSPT